MNDDELDRELSKWELDIADDNGFQSAVWREIAMRDSQMPGSRFRDALDRFFTPRLAIPTGAVALLATIAMATLHGMESRQKIWNSLAATYSQTIDPAAHSLLMKSGE